MSIVKKILWILPLMLLSLMATAQYSGGSYSGIDQVSLISSTSCSYTSAVSSNIYSGSNGEGSALGTSIITLTSCVPRDTTIISLVYGGGNGAGDIQLASIITGLHCINDSSTSSPIYGGGTYSGLDQLAIISATICTFPLTSSSVIYGGGSDTGSTSAAAILGISCPYPTPVTTYAYSGGDGGGCSDTGAITTCSADSFYATISQGERATVCAGDALSLNVLVSGGNSPFIYQWYGDTIYLSGRTSSSASFSTNTSGTYHLYENTLDNTGLVSRDTIIITVLNSNSASRSASICAGQSFFAGGASQTTAGIYYDTLVNISGCDSILTTTLTVSPAVAARRNISICAPNTFVAGGIARSISGTYYDTLRAASYRGCDSVLTTVLTVNARATASRSVSICAPATYIAGGLARSSSGTYYDTLVGRSYLGCDSILSTVLTVNARASSSRNLSICAPTSIVLGGVPRSSSGTYYDTLVARSYLGCDSILTTNLTVIPRPLSSRSVSICSPATYVVGGIARSSSGTYYDTLRAASYRGCDSIVSTILTVNSRATASRTVSICAPSTFVAGGIPRSSSGTYFDTLRAASYTGCDSILTTILTVSSRATAVRTITICSPATYTAGGLPRSTSGTYYDTLRSASITGCDSIITTVLTVNSRASGTRSVTICSPTTYVAGGSARSTSGTYYDTLVGRSYLGCDSILTTILTVNARATATRSISICAPTSIVLGGIARSSSGLYYDTLVGRSYLGCDSILTTNLTVILRATSSRSVSICSPATYVAGGSARSSSGTYYDTLRTASYRGCDSIVTTILTVNPRATASRSVSICFPSTYVAGGSARSSSGTYYDTLRGRSYLGCDSILTTVLTVNPRASASRAVTICAPATFYAGGASRSSSGSYYDTLRGRTYLGCDSILNTVLTVNVRGIYTRNVAICAPATYYAGGQYRTSSGIYTDTLYGRSYNGCDSILVTNLNVGSRAAGSRTVNICYPATFTAGGSARASSGIYFDTLRAASFNGCDSILRTDLTVFPRATGSRTVDICYPATFVAGGIARSVSGSYYDTLRSRSVYGCDSILNTLLVVHNRAAGTRAVSICYPATFTAGGIARSTSGSYYDTLRAASSFGCDSILRTNLTVNPRTSGTYNATACGTRGWVFNGRVYTRSGTYYDTIRNYLGCDSIVRINLSIYPTYNDTIRRTIVYGDSTLFDGAWRKRANTYVATHLSRYGCDSITTLVLTVTGTPPRLAPPRLKSATIIICNDTISNIEAYFPNTPHSSYFISQQAGEIDQNGKLTWKKDFEGMATLSIGRRINKSAIFDSTLIIERRITKKPFFDIIEKNDGYQFVSNAVDDSSTYWSFGDGSFAFAIAPEHKYHQAGQYDVSIASTEYCSSGSYHKLLKVEKPALSESVASAQLIPNPFSRNLSLVFDKCDGQSFDAFFLSETGKLLWTRKFELNNENSSCAFDISDLVKLLPAGYYHLQLKSAQQFFVIKVIKFE
jgi:hypothetical protein